MILTTVIDSASNQASLDSLKNMLTAPLNSEEGREAVAGFFAMGFGMIVAFLLIFGAIMIFMLAAMWRIYTKAGEPGWAILIPIYNVIVLLKIAGRPWWWFFILWLIVPAIIVIIDLAKSFGKSTGFAIGLLFLGIFFYPILGFGSAKYVGPRGVAKA